MRAAEMKYDAVEWLQQPNHLDEHLPTQQINENDLAKVFQRYHTLKDGPEKRLFNSIFPPEQVSIWDPEREHVTLGSPEFEMMDESQLAAVGRRERLQVDEWMSRKQRGARHEAQRASRYGHFGAKPPLPMIPKRLDKTVARPSRFHMSLVDTSFSRDRNYKVAVRDRKGELRQPDEIEMKAIRAGHSDHKKAFFLQDWHRPVTYGTNSKRGSAETRLSSYDRLMNSGENLKKLAKTKEIFHQIYDKAYHVPGPPGYTYPFNGFTKGLLTKEIIESKAALVRR